MQALKQILFLYLILLFCPVFILSVDKIDINTATLSQLDELIGIGPKYAQAIIDARPYSSVDDLLKIKGIGEKTLQKIKDQGLACVNCETESIVYPDGVIINEILPAPKGADEIEEWIELYNKNNFDVDVSGWQIQDTEGTITTFTIPQNTKILADNFLVFKRPQTKIILNNESDKLNLILPNQKIADSVSFPKAPVGQSYNKTESGWTWSATLTSGSKNIITNPAAATSKISASAKSGALPKSQNSDNNIIEESLASINNAKTAEKTQNNPWFLFIAVLLVAIISAISILIIKLKFNKK
jgi:competence ComEA-like helix-hairpin-helix protein